MSLRLKINLIVAALTLLFAAAVLALQLRSMRESVHEEVVAANRVAAQLLQRTAWRYAAQGEPAMLAFLQGMGRVRSNDITLFDAQGRELYRSPPSTYKAGRDAPEWFSALIAPPPSVQAIEFPDGKLVVRANASRAELDAWDYAVALGAERPGAADGGECAGVLAGRARGAAVQPDRAGPEPAAGRALRRGAAAAGGHRGRRPSAPRSTAWSASCRATSRPSAARCAPSCSSPTAAN